MSKRALRCLAFAIKTGESLGDLETYDGDAKDTRVAPRAGGSLGVRIGGDGLTFVGVAGLRRSSSTPEVRAAVDACRTAGIRVVVITGDNKLTAEAICADIGVFEKLSDAVGSDPSRGREFAEMTRAKKIAALTAPGGCVCSRARAQAQTRHRPIAQGVRRDRRDDGRRR